MSKVHDAKIIELKKQIEEKKEKLKDVKRFSPVTKCIINLDGKAQNLNVLKKEDLILLLVKLNLLKKSADELGYPLTIDSYLVQDWMEDIQSKLKLTEYKEEENKLNSLNQKLTTLLSEDKKVELELEEIEGLLK
ncbi:hypothetical protein [Clostridium disporicum]|uniref:hypothetical protein n=1 Tax=Clostridium disporicum TaxID=84024 RepID=UPI0034A48C27